MERNDSERQQKWEKKKIFFGPATEGEDQEVLISILSENSNSHELMIIERHTQCMR